MNNIWKKVRTVTLPKPGNVGTIEKDETYYSLDGKTILYNGYIIKDADFETFEYCFSFAKDKNKCYRADSIYKDADPKTFIVLNYHFAKDKNNIYSLGGIVKNLDYQTFEILDCEYISSSDEIRNSKLSFSSDKSGIWWMDYYSYKPVLIKGTNKSTFKRIDECFSKDDKHIYFGGTRLPKANPLTWKRLHENTYYSQDLNRIYFTKNLLKQADVDTFEVLSIPINTGLFSYAKDKNWGYMTGSVISHEELEQIIKEGLW
ncbi:putative membrane protein [Flavobacterium anhuiense]|uniref:Putative membrane protein n=1 Tax=Flavobacterium anhuiense TaxID=459526 RepID=A0A444VWW6_9FLAO|nr:DKNYY domain-containing protein [Flavobacterium anhuiense]RYJ38028.1 putative membrane protein [Flavobacterium anhuiense]